MLWMHWFFKCCFDGCPLNFFRGVRKKSRSFWKPKEIWVQEIKLPKFMAKRTFGCAYLDQGASTFVIKQPWFESRLLHELIYLFIVWPSCQHVIFLMIVTILFLSASSMRGVVPGHKGCQTNVGWINEGLKENKHK